VFIASRRFQVSHAKVSTVMTTDVASVRPDTSFHELTQLLAERKVSAVPVVDHDGRVLGVVSEADLLHKLEFADGLSGHSILERPVHRLARAKADGQLARDLMTSPAVTVPAGVSVVKAARLLESQRVKRAPVVDDGGRLVGIVSRAVLLKVFLRPDNDIQREVVGDLLHRLWIGPSELAVTVADGVVTIQGEVEQRSLIDLVARLVRSVDGVVEVLTDLTYAVDDTASPEARYYRPLV
jgi:CBS domain-containing protein